MQPLLVQKVISILLLLFSPIMLAPAVVGVLYGENEIEIFVIASVMTAGIGLLLWLPVRRVTNDLKLRDGFLVVVLLWAVLGIFGAIPFYFSAVPGLQMSIYDALFESISGLTTTGATVLTGLDDLPRSFLFYRQLLQWLGGLGIVVLAIAVLPMLSVGGMQLTRGEGLGSVHSARLTPRITETAKVLWYIYVVLTTLCALSYWLAGMDVFDAICHSFTTISIGGFSTHDASIGYFNNIAIEITAVVFMLIAGANFGLHFGALRHGSLNAYLHDHEFRFYIGIISFAVVVTFLYLLASGTDSSHAWHQALFQAVSIGTTSGFTTTDYTLWPGFLPVFLISVSFIGGCVGSTAGGIKVVRFMLLVKQGLRELFRLIHPHSVAPITLGQKVVTSDIVDAVWGFFSAYVGIFVLMIILLLASGLDEVSAFGAVAATLNNLGPGLGEVSANYSSLGNYDKLILCLSMLLGRLEIFTLLVVFTPRFWRL